jgi:hypothetical protein
MAHTCSATRKRRYPNDEQMIITIMEPPFGAIIGAGIDALGCGYVRRYPMKAAAYPLLLAAVLGFSAAPASAQVTPGDPAGNQKDQWRPQDMPKGEKDGTETLSDKLNASGGVIKPPRDVDPGISITAPVPEPNSTPVIPPPGTPGGPPGPEPK